MDWTTGKDYQDGQLEWTTELTFFAQKLFLWPRTDPLTLKLVSCFWSASNGILTLLDRITYFTQ